MKRDVLSFQPVKHPTVNTDRRQILRHHIRKHYFMLIYVCIMLQNRICGVRGYILIGGNGVLNRLKW